MVEARNSTANDRVTLMIAAFDAEYTPYPAAGRKPMIDAVVMIAPPPAAARVGHHDVEGSML